VNSALSRSVDIRIRRFRILRTLGQLVLYSRYVRRSVAGHRSAGGEIAGIGRPPHGADRGLATLFACLHSTLALTLALTGRADRSRAGACTFRCSPLSLPPAC
jgi:hypothetical protein